MLDLSGPDQTRLVCLVIRMKFLITGQVIQTLQHLLLPAEVQFEAVKRVIQVNLWDQDLRGRRCHGNSKKDGELGSGRPADQQH